MFFSWSPSTCRRRFVVITAGETFCTDFGCVDSYLADGWGGQRIIVFPSLDLVVVFTGGNYATPEPVHEMVCEYILPAIQ
jgi:hypothetical protein